LLYGALLMECGRLEQAAEVVEQFDDSERLWNLMPPKHLLMFVHTAHGDYERASQLVRSITAARESQTTESLLATLPLVAPPRAFAQIAQDGWPMWQTMTVANYLQGHRENAVALEWETAMLELEAGYVEKAIQSMQAILADNPDTSLRPLLQFYLDAADRTPGSSATPE